MVKVLAEGMACIERWLSHVGVHRVVLSFGLVGWGYVLNVWGCRITNDRILEGVWWRWSLVGKHVR